MSLDFEDPDFHQGDLRVSLLPSRHNKSIGETIIGINGLNSLFQSEFDEVWSRPSFSTDKKFDNDLRSSLQSSTFSPFVFEVTDKKLVDHLSPHVVFFFQAMGIFPYHSMKEYSTVGIYGICLATCFLLFFGYLDVLFQYLLLAPNVALLSRRMALKSAVKELELYDSSTRTSITFFVVSCILALSFPLTGLINQSFYTFIPAKGQIDLYYFMVFIGQLSGTSYLAASLLFILVDAALFKAIVIDLDRVAGVEALTLEDFDRARAEVKRRHRASYYTSAILIISGLNCIGFVLRLYASGNLATDAIDVLGAVAFTAKEILFVCIVFREAASVNECVDNFARKLANTPWLSGDNHSRLAIYVANHSDPISFPVAGARLSRASIFFQFVGFITSIAVSLVLRAQT